MAVVTFNNLGVFGLSSEGERPEDFAKFTTIHGFLPSRNGAVLRRKQETGSAHIVTSGTWARYVDVDRSNAVLFKSGSTTCYALENSSTVNSVTLSVATTTLVDAIPYGSKVIYNPASANPPEIIDLSSNTAAQMASFPAGESATRVAVYKERVIAITGKRVRYSSVVEAGADPSSWDETDPASGAGYFDLVDAVGDVVCAKILGGALIVYCSGSTHEVQYVGGSNLYAQRRISETGANSLDSVVDVGGRHLVWTGEDAIYLDGGGAVSVFPDASQRDMVSITNNHNTSHVIFDRGAGLAYFLGSDNHGGETKYYVLELSTGKWFTESIPSDVYRLYYGYIPSSISSNSRQIVALETSGTTPVKGRSAGIAATCELRNIKYCFGSLDHKVITGIRLFSKVSPTPVSVGDEVNISITGYHADGSATGSSSAVDTLNDVQSNGWMPVDVFGVYFDIQITRTNAFDAGLDLYEIQFDVSINGEDG